MKQKKEMPKINVGRYAGTPVDQLPNSYLRWLLTQDFPKEIVEVAREKLKGSVYGDEYLSVSRHTLDQYSLRFMGNFEARNDKSVGFGSFVAREAQKAWDKGEDISKRRHKNDGISKELNGIVWVFNTLAQFSDYKEVITCYALDNDYIIEYNEL